MTCIWWLSACPCRGRNPAASPNYMSLPGKLGWGQTFPRDKRKSLDAKGAKEAKFRHGIVQGRRAMRPSSRVGEVAMGWKVYCWGIWGRRERAMSRRRGWVVIAWARGMGLKA